MGIIKQHNKTKNSIVFFIFFILITGIGTWYYAIDRGRIIEHNHQQAKGGVLSVDQNILDKNKLIYLEGEFQFYWKQLLTPEDFKHNQTIKRPQLTYIPSLWDSIDSQGRAYGYATYRLKIKVPKDDYYGIKIKELDCAYKIWMNEKSDSVGIVTNNPKTYIPSWRRKELYCYSKNKEIDLVLQIANFSHRKGGPEDVMLFGKGKDIYSYKKLQYGLNVFLFGVFIILSIYFFGMTLFGRRDPSILNFSLLCLFMSLRIITTGEKLLLDFIPSLNWDIAIRIEYLSYTILVPIFLYFIRSIFPAFYNIKILKIVKWISYIFCAILVIPPYYFSYTPILYQFVIILMVFYILYGLIKALQKKEEFSFIFFLGYVFFFFVVLKDIFYYNKIENSTFLMPYGMFILIFSFTFAMSQKMTLLFLDVEVLSNALEKQNKNLERRVLSRTKKIMVQKDELLNQKSKLEIINKHLTRSNQYKDDMTGMIVHDLKNPLNAILNIIQIKDLHNKDEIIEHAGKEMLHLIMNLLDLNKAEEIGLKPKWQSCLFSEIIKSVTVDLQLSLSVNKVEITQKDHNDYVLNCDIDLIKRVCINLLTNAIRYAPLKSKVIIHTSKISTENKKMLKVEITNYGPVIEKDKTEKIFERYYHDTQKETSVKSTGLGLPFCKIAVEAHGGEIGVTSTEKETSFYFTIPLVEEV